MEIEQLPPKQPNFLLIVVLSCITLLVLFVLAYLFIDFDGGRLTFPHHHAHPTAQLALPAPSSMLNLLA
jgi:hypothetical protein